MQDEERIRVLEVSAREHNKLRLTHDALLREKAHLETALDHATTDITHFQYSSVLSGSVLRCW